MLSSLVSNGLLQTPDRLEPMVPWWSFTKTVLAATALSLVRDGLIRLDDPVLDQPFTLRQLLRHGAGLADYGELAQYHAAVSNNEPAWPANEMMQRLEGAQLRYSPGTGWRYSNVGYWFIARLIERLTDLTLDEAVIQRALCPLGLSNVRFAKTRADLQATHTASSSNCDPAWVYHGLLIGPGLLLEMQTARRLGGPIPGRPWITPGYGLGVMQGSIDGGYSLCGHTGCGPGSVIAVYRVCDRDASACSAVFAAGASEGAVEAIVVAQLMQALRQRG